EADLTLFCSRSVFEEESAECRMAAFVDHGVDFEQFRSAGNGPVSEPGDVRAIPHPRVGFVGGIDAHTFDPELFLQTAAALPECAFVMVGACSLPEGWCNLPNVHFLGRKAYDEVAAYMAACDVLIMPWNRSPWIKACNPVKLKEYLAVGRPVVSTPFDELEHYQGLVCVADDAQKFAEGIRTALKAQPDADAMRQRVEQETWTAKARMVLENLQQAGVSFRGTPAARRRNGAAGQTSAGVLSETRAPAHTNHKRQLLPLGLLLPSKRGSYWRKRHFAAAGMLALLAVWVTRDAWADILRLASRNEECSHIWLVIPVALWLAKVRREEVSVPRRSSYLLAPLLVVLGWALYSLGDTFLFQSLWHLGAVVIVVGCALSVLGGSVLLRFWPSFAVLVFLVPVPKIVQQQIGLPMQAYAARITAFILETLGTPIALSGSVLQVNGVSVAVAEACNGIRMLFALTLVCFLYAFSTRLSTQTRILIVLMSPFVAIAANVLRLIPTVWLYGYTNSHTADMFHDISGWAMMPVALFGLFSAGALLRWTFAKDSDQPEEARQSVASST
ncbi:MAG TPA: exosortase, partial [Candidatus Hydrogenedentes bacterium]|nr:exosortase [Candidatus Hydrogenedentota bacterium]